MDRVDEMTKVLDQSDQATLENIDQLWPEPTMDELVARSQTIVHTPYGLQDGNGVDVSLIIENLRVSPLERLRRGDAATRNAEQVRRNVERCLKSA
jgi:hypothetical protein